jgi:hypothetical protein
LKYYLAKFEILGPVMSGHLPDFSRGKSEPDAVVAGVPPAIRLVLQPTRLLPLQEVGIVADEILEQAQGIGRRAQRSRLPGCSAHLR